MAADFDWRLREKRIGQGGLRSGGRIRERGKGRRRPGDLLRPSGLGDSRASGFEGLASGA